MLSHFWLLHELVQNNGWDSVYDGVLLLLDSIVEFTSLITLTSNFLNVTSLVRDILVLISVNFTSQYM